MDNSHRRDMPTQEISNWSKFSLLMWKNWLLVWRKKLQTLLEILIPVIFTGLLVFIRSINDPIVYDNPFDYDNLPLGSINWEDPIYANSTAFPRVISYAPSNDFTDGIMADVSQALQLGLNPFETVDGLNLALSNENGRPLAGIIFEYGSDPNSVNNLHFRVRFPAELRSNFVLEGLWASPLIHNWQTDMLYPLFQEGGPRERTESDGGSPPAYYRELFIGIQSAISTAFINQKKPDSFSGEDPEMTLQRFSYPPATVDLLLEILKLFVPLIFFLSFLYPCINSVKMIAVEKEKQLKEAMKIMGLSGWLHWTAWFTKIMIFMIVTITLIVILLCVSWYPNTNVAVFTHSDPTAIWVFLLSYSLSITTFIFMMSVLFSKANTAATITGLMWFIFSAPYSFTQPNYNTLSLGTKLVVSLFHNTGMSYGFLLILTHEANLEGLQWSNFFEPVSIDDDFSVGLVVIMLLVSSVIYLLIALYLEKIFPGDFGVPAKWYFPVEGLFGLNKSEFEDSERMANFNQNNANFEPDPKGKFAGVQTRGLRKVYGNKKVAVQGLTLNMYDDEITVLLGDNGAGKTTTMSMLTGMFPPTSGTALVNGCDIRSNISGVRQSIGLCPQHNILFDDLTVREHIVFFGKLKGLTNKNVEREVDKYVDILELQPKKNAMSKTLSGGMKRKLSVGVALCGNSKVVLCDEPTSGMDPAARRALWDLLQQEKRGRTILLSTHFMDEADVLGDRIAIMHSGELKCYGSSFFLKKMFGTGYELVCEKSIDCDVNGVARLIRKYIPDIKISSNIGAELSFKLEDKYSQSYQMLLKDLESRSLDLGVDGYGISLTTLEEVFIKVTSERFDPDYNKKSALSRMSEQRYQEAIEKTSFVSLNSIQNGTESVTGFELFWSQLKAMFLKKAIYTWRNWILFLVQIVIPIILTIITFLIARSFTVGDVLNPLPIHLDSYNNNPVVLFSDATSLSDTVSTQFLAEYRNLFDQPPTPRILQEVQNMRSHILNLDNRELVTFNIRNLAGVTVTNDKITAWFNNQPYHTVPLTVNLAYNALLRVYCPDCTISVTNEPLPFTFMSRTEMLRAGNNMGFQLASNVGFSMCFVAAFYIIFYIKERVSRAKLLQFVSGINIWTFWATSFVWDIFTFLVTTMFLLATLAAFQEDGWSKGPELGRVLVLIMCFIWAVLPFVYIFSMIFDVPSSGYIKTVMIGIFLGIALFYVVFSLEFPDLDLLHVAEGLTWAFLAVPHFALTQGLSNLNQMNAFVTGCTQACDLIPICQKPTDLCFIQSQCCVLEFFAWESPGIGRNIAFMLGVGVLFIVLLLLKELRVFDKLVYCCRRQMQGALPPESEDQVIDSDVMNEKYRVRNMNYTQLSAQHLVMKNMTKFYKDFLAVNQLCVAVEPGQCFGLLGVNGAGKTSSFKMLTGDETISSGEAWIRGISIKTDMKEVYKDIGYCPQFDALLEDLTGRETLKMFCFLRGIPSHKINEIAEKLAKELNFIQHYDKKTKEYSGGNKRKLSTALALIGNPSVVYLDEPTTGMDPGAKRHLWEVMSKYRNLGKSIILTSHSMEECEALCTRLAIMVNGEFKCLGSTQHLKNKFSKGFLLIIQMKRNSDDQYNFDSRADIQRVKHYVQSYLTGSVLKEEYQGRLSYYIPITNLKWSTMFGIMESAKQELNIESYSLSQTSLEQVFLSFTKFQREESR